EIQLRGTHEVNGAGASLTSGSPARRREAPALEAHRARSELFLRTRTTSSVSLPRGMRSPGFQFGALRRTSVSQVPFSASSLNTGTSRSFPGPGGDDESTEPGTARAATRYSRKIAALAVMDSICESRWEEGRIGHYSSYAVPAAFV